MDVGIADLAVLSQVWLAILFTGGQPDYRYRADGNRAFAKTNSSKKIAWYHFVLEGILIDPIGVFIALLCYEWISAGGSQAANHFALRIIVGVTIGLAGGWGLSLIVRKSWVVQEHVNSFIIAAAIAIFVLSDQLSHESGLLSVIVAGFVMSYLDHGQLDQVRAYKEQITEMLIGLLFILLAANLNISAFQQYGWRLPLLIVTIMVVVRPLNIFVSTWKSQLSLADKLFLSWVAPRGIVAASMASLFALSLNSSGDHVQAQFLEIFTYSVIIGTVILQASSAGLVGKILGILAPSPKGWLIIGACKLGRTIAKFIQHKNVPVVIIDSNLHLIRLARKDGLTAIHDNAQLFRLEEQPELYNFSAVLAMTSNDAYNTICCQHWQKELPLAKCYEWSHPDLRGEVNMICAGQPVWQHLALRKVVNSEHDLEISIRHVDAKDCPHPLRVLMCYFQETFYPYLPKEASGQLDILEYHGDPGLEFKLKPEWILFTKAKTSSEAVEQIFKKMIIDIPQLPVERLIASFSRQELDQHELLAYDIALFHTYSHHIQTCAVAIARLQKPIMVMEEEVDIIFVILSPEGQPQKHLETLARIGRFILNEENRKQMREALTPEQMLALFY